MRGTATLEGVGMHTGAQTRVTFRAAAPGDGVTFRRVDLDGSPNIPARLSSVTAVERRTTLATNGAEVHTVEHLLAAVAALQIDDLLVEITGPEPPILDGSFTPFLEALKDAEPVEHGGEAQEFTVREAFSVAEGESSYLVGPAPALRLSATIEFPHPLIGRQSGSYDITTETFARELAPARTFGFVREVEALRAKGLITGGTIKNAIVLDDEAVVGTTLLWPDEFVRHKTADLLGDLALLGGRIKAHVVATRPSHRGNVALGRAIRLRATRTSGTVMDIRDILNVIPHRYPFLLVDRIVEIEDKKRIVGIKNVTFNEPFFQGHFPGHPVMPGVLIIEAMAQVGGMLLMQHWPRDDHANKVVYFMSLDHVKFRRPVVPGDQLRCELEMVQFRGKTCRMKGVAYVDGNVVAEAEMMAAVVDK
ncbi:MAG: UDP-3-O-[3-hydroxymyristoyl] N-acetylglucosamine deacetylase [Gemmatimonadetes bacterium]|nr:UDP-3-O-[3-hydroxymyristoyl] N-acetylglucosamine deacetylase [Gemmatimonadota bacterium]